MLWSKALCEDPFADQQEEATADATAVPRLPAVERQKKTTFGMV